MADWKSRLVVSYVDNGKTNVISPIDTFSPTFALNAEVLHSIERSHIGVIYSPQNISFSMTVKAIGSAAAELTHLALTGTRFEINLQESGDGTQWAFAKVVLTDCVITSANPTSASPSGAPSATFSGFSLAASAEGANKTTFVP
jgi:hypothetical protein